jgi:hypothetical protein
MISNLDIGYYFDLNNHGIDSYEVLNDLCLINNWAGAECPSQPIYLLSNFFHCHVYYSSSGLTHMSWVSSQACSLSRCGMTMPGTYGYHSIRHVTHTRFIHHINEV